MIGYVLIALGLGDLVGLAHFLTQHRGGLGTALLAALGWVAHRLRRRFKHTGRHVAGMPKAEARALREARKAAALNAATELAGEVVAA